MELRQKTVDNCLILAIMEFEITFATARDLTREILRLVSQRSARRLIVDLAEVGLLDSAGVGALVAVRSQFKRAAGRLVLCGLSPRAALALRRVTLDTIFEVRPDVASALNAFVHTPTALPFSGDRVFSSLGERPKSPGQRRNLETKGEKSGMNHQGAVVVIDYGSQYTQLIARRVREAGVYSEIHPCNVGIETIRALSPGAIILSGGPASVGQGDSPGLDLELLSLGAPVLGVCYGMQLLGHYLAGGELAAGKDREYGRAEMTLTAGSPLWEGLDSAGAHTVWMSHGDQVLTPPAGFSVIGRTRSVAVAAMADEKRRIYAVQFHPEVAHTEEGTRILHNFLFRVAGLKTGWSMASFVKTQIEGLREKIGEQGVVCALSGGVDSTVVAVLLGQAIGKRLHCIFVDNGVLRQGEGEEVTAYLSEHFDLNLKYVQASEMFLSRLKGVTDPEQKRKIIGHTFIEVFDREAASIPGVKFLAQGTLYPDVIESVSFKGPSAIIKSHHNVGGLPEKMNLALIEPLRELFKDEVRKVALELGLPDHIIWRHPFPGPGLAIRVLGEITPERLHMLRQADRIVQAELVAADWYRKVWQGFAVLLPLKTVGVMGDGRTYEHVIALRIVDSLDAMTADWSRVPAEILSRISSRIINEVKGVNRVVLDISSKPPSTIEWE